jgi:AraC family transcriptional regulator
MGTRRAEQDYRERVARVVAAIVADPMADHRLEDLARLAHFSPFHFHRVYRAVAGETVNATIRRVRLALATRSLAQGNSTIADVGLASGYESPQAFTRAFREFAGQSPIEFRREMRAAFLDTVPAPHSISVAARPLMRIVERPQQSVHALRHRGPFSTIPHTHLRLRCYAGFMAVSSWLGISCGDPRIASTFSYHAALASPHEWPNDDEELENFDIPAGLYAVHCLAGPYTRINASVNALYAQWLPNSGYEPDDRPMLEHYLNSPRQVAPSALRTDLLIPVRSAS